MTPQTAKYAAFACFGLAAVLGVLSATGAFTSVPTASMPPPCRIMDRLPIQGETIPVGDWCFNVGVGQTLYFRPATTFEFVSDGPEVSISVFDAHTGKKIPGVSRVVGVGQCFRIPDNVAWDRLEIVPTKTGGKIRTRVGHFDAQMIGC